MAPLCHGSPNACLKCVVDVIFLTGEFKASFETVFKSEPENLHVAGERIILMQGSRHNRASMGWHGEAVSGGMGRRHGEAWGGMGRHGEAWGGMGRRHGEAWEVL